MKKRQRLDEDGELEQQCIRQLSLDNTYRHDLSYGGKLSKSRWYNRLKEFFRRHMKTLWIYVMLGSMGVFIGSLVQSISRFDSNGIDWLVVLLWCVTGISIFTSILGFSRASKLGKEEDIKRMELYAEQMEVLRHPNPDINYDSKPDCYIDEIPPKQIPRKYSLLQRFALFLYNKAKLP